MVWRFALAIVALAACGSDKSKLDSPAAGPVYSPSIAYALRGIAPDCKLDKTPTAQSRECRGSRGFVWVSLGEGDHFTHLKIALISMIQAEARSHFEQPLTLILGAEGRDAVGAQLDKLETGQSAELAVGQARIAVSAGGRSRIAPEYTVEISW